MYILAGAVIFVLLVVVIIYNGLIVKRNRIENAFASMDAMLKKRYDLIPNLVATVKGYAKHESALFQRVTDLRARARSAGLATDEVVSINNEIGRAIFGIIGVVEDYPELKASDNFMHLQRTLNEIEEQISASRRAYNAAVTDFNNAVEMFPSSIIARVMRYGKRQLFEIPAQQRRAPQTGELLDPCPDQPADGRG
jgi:LemA protein